MTEFGFDDIDEEALLRMELPTSVEVWRLIFVSCGVYVRGVLVVVCSWCARGGGAFGVLGVLVPVVTPTLTLTLTLNPTLTLTLTLNPKP